MFRVSYIRIRKHYLHLPYLVLGALEFAVLFSTFYLLGFVLDQLGGSQAGLHADPASALLFAFVMSCGTLAMGVYFAMVREGFASMFFRTLVAFCFVGGIALTILYMVLPTTSPGSDKLFWAVLLAIALVTVVRQLFLRVVDSDQLARRVVIYGGGEFAESLMTDYENNLRASGIRIIGCVPDSANPKVDSRHHLPAPEDFYQFCRQNRISEIVIAQRERRTSQGGRLPVDSFMDCKLRGIDVTDAVAFYERELKKARLELVHPSWILFSDGFKASRSRDFTKRVVDLLISLTLAIVLAPFMVLTALAVVLESGWPIFYSQNRVGVRGKVFRIYKFRSMRQDAEKDGKAQWASENDSRVTRVGAFIRNTRLDETPQLWNVIKGEMSIVGPRPERPEFVDQLKEQVPFYNTRHYVKPGLMGWAQLNYPYGASIEDARGKLEYDLYYSKNHSIVMDLLIMIQTVEVVLLGKGVR
ncbi:sugar transferase, PEP-CTERM system associated/exopolysaccharide biosynthesis polyprenyl glycosylphosphotransferase [Marinobacter daqiaonensis]|uniref:Sugar transferase, PEP-CTERM system associated/exopolysaccharide biosynthesis polyprenyl glycosylphosphotransferase n=1 Tax=Marinobacter daqiaonensis TaxID=650891 RepID=A0A1I6HX07_9GAMM|nr:TIGR03013 family XrtA/PEP-CTERM system glycosyltransferase [Marinobacter daqiaonensis]SFR58983.1 sugar transferase, PEP-CTERM system associated/exopolysaccharide biosynthesis polyprenyl glycosylphosphotransferase [Marinobacter daqiaonensis]